LLRVVDPPGQDLSFVDEVEFFVEAEGLERRRIASGGPFAEGETSAALVRDDVQLAAYAAAPALSITAEATGQRPPEETTVEAVVRLSVDVNVTGAACSVAQPTSSPSQ
jgi:hypothetical protein